MASWFDDTENDIDTDLFGPDSTQDSLAIDPSASSPDDDMTGAASQYDTPPSNGNAISRFKENIGPAKFTALICIIIGAIVLVAVALIFGGTSSSGKNTTKPATQEKQPQQQVQQEQQVQQQVQQEQPQQQVQQQPSGSWLDASNSSFDLNSGGLGLSEEFTIKDVHIYANRIGGGYEMRAEATGTLASYGNSLYTVVLPLDKAMLILDSGVLKKSTPLVINVNYKYFVNDSTIWIYDVEYLED